MGGAIYDTLSNREATTYSVTLGPRAEQNLYTAELAAILMAIGCLPPDLQGRQITIFSSNQAALLALSQPKQQSGQISIAQIYNIARTLRQRSNCVFIAWVLQGEFKLGKKAKVVVWRATI